MTPRVTDILTTTSMDRSRLQCTVLALHGGLPGLLGQHGRLSGLCVLIVASAFSACTVTTDPVRGETGPEGKPGVDADKGEVQALKVRLDALEKRFADPECPPQYTRDGLGNPLNPDSVACYLGDPGAQDTPIDRIVRVGRGTTAFWIDAYESTMWDGPDDSALPVLSGRADGLLITWNVVSHQYVNSAIYAWSRRDELPSTGVTWFLANAACAQSGKRLPTTSEWLLAAAGTLDPPDPQFIPACLTSGGVGPRKTGEGQNCRSYWGAEDMLGNIAEWTVEWFASPSQSQGATKTPWPSSFAGEGDQTIGIISDATSAPGSPATVGIPSAGLHGGNYVGVIEAGLFTLDVAQAPSYADTTIGFRCVIPR